MTPFVYKHLSSRILHYPATLSLLKALRSMTWITIEACDDGFYCYLDGMYVLFFATSFLGVSFSREVAYYCSGDSCVTTSCSFLEEIDEGTHAHYQRRSLFFL